ncbi:hypothetical protein EV360DRAFT_84895 [Lentinula raphanica]|nr:hypothetical protein EV360DRAFT_84895 [Lentinula raphanica]
MVSSSSPQATEHPTLSAHYLLAPLETLDESLNDPHEERINIHDLIETYNVLALRIKEILLRTSDSDQTAAPLTLLTERSQVLINALRRDVKRVVQNPLTTTLYEKGTKDGMDLEDEVYYARDLALLGQQAIRLTSELFAFPQLYSRLTVSQLRFLLHDILIILSEPSLPTPHSKRTFALLRWILQVQKLPFNVLSPHSAKIIVCVKQWLKEEKEQIIVDGLKILAELLRGNPKLFLGPACDLNRDTLAYLLTDSANTRSAAAHALSAFAYAKVVQSLPCSPDPYKHKVSYELSRASREFVIQYIEGDDPTQTPSLRRILESSLKDSHFSTHSCDPQWAAVVIASFIVLIDIPLFESETLFKMKDLLWLISDHPSATVRLLHTPVWKCCVWAFGRIPVDSNMSKKAQALITQDLRNGVGALLLHVMFNLDGKDMVSRTLEALTWMLDNKLSRQDGIFLLCHLLDSPRGNPDIVPILHEQLFDGKILDTHLADLMKHTTTTVTSDSKAVRGIVRQLSVQEIIEHWEKLYQLWSYGVKYILKHTIQSESHKPIFAAWKRLLRADIECCRKQDLAAPSRRVVNILGHLCDAFALETSDAQMEVKEIQLLRMLWHVAQRCFSHSSLKETRTVLLSSIVRRDFQISDMTVRTEWLELCQVISKDSAGDEGSVDDSSSQTWLAVARIWADIDGVAGENLVAFLKLVFPERLTTEEATQVWKRLLQRAIADCAQTHGRESCLSLWNTFATNDQTLLLAFPKQFFAMSSAFIVPFDSELAKAALQFLDKTLQSLYAPDHFLDTSMRYIDMIHALLHSIPDAHLVFCISSLSTSLRCWIEDKSTLVPDAAYSQSVFPLYEAILSRIRQQTPNEETLGLLWKFFLSPIERPVFSKEAITTFQTFWMATYHGQDVLFEPELIRYLKGLDMALGVGLAAGLTQSDDSQLSNGSHVSETQCSGPLAPTGSQILEKFFTTVSSADNTDNVAQPSSPIRDPATPSRGVSSKDKSHHRSDSTSSGSSRGSKRKRSQEVEDIVEETPMTVPSIPVLQEPVAAESNEPRTPSRHSAPIQTLRDKGKGKAPAHARERLRTPVRRRPKARSAGRQVRASQLMTPEPSAPPSSHHVASPHWSEAEEQYESWENAVASPRSFAQISKGMDVDMEPINFASVERDRSNANNSDDVMLSSPSIRAAKRRKSNLRTVENTRSPAPTTSRNQKGDRATPARIVQLQRAFKAFKDDQEMPLEELVKAAELAQAFGTTMNDLVHTRAVRERS